MDERYRELERRAKTGDKEAELELQRLRTSLFRPDATKMVWISSTSTAQRDLNLLAVDVIDFISDVAEGEYYPDKIAILSMNTEFNPPNDFGFLTIDSIYYTAGRVRERPSHVINYFVKAIYGQRGIKLEFYGNSSI